MFTRSATSTEGKADSPPACRCAPFAERLEKRMTTYTEKLKDPRWQKKRLEVLNRDEWKCCGCGSGSNTLHVHHAYYASGRDPWDYPSETLTTLCAECHHGDGDDQASEWLLKTIETLVGWICEIAPEGMPADNVLADLGLMIGEAGREWRGNNRRRLTQKEWLEFYMAVPALLEAHFSKQPKTD